MNPPHVSVVTPTLNRVDLVRRTMDSLRIQTFRDFEHIVIDGGSTDGTVELLASMEGTYPLRWISEPDTGMYNAINKGLATARGEILAYLNSDDLYFPWTLEVVVAAFERHPSVDFVYGDALSIDDKTGVRRIYWQYPFHRDTVRRSGFLAQPTVFWRRHVLETVGQFDEALRYVADCDYWMRAGSHFRFRKMNELLAVERDHPGTLRHIGRGALDAELARVRSRYVTLHGLRHRFAHARNIRREQILERLYYVMLLVQSRLPGRFPRWAWARFLQADATKLDATAVFRLLLPKQRFARKRVLQPSRRWLEPPV